MRKYTLIVEDTEYVDGFPDNQVINITFTADTLDQVYEGMRCFVAAAGFEPGTIEKFFDN